MACLGRYLSIATAVVAVLAAAGQAAIVDVGSWSLASSAGDFVDGPGEQEVVNGTVSLPFVETQSAISGDSSSTTQYHCDVGASSGEANPRADVARNLVIADGSFHP